MLKKILAITFALALLISTLSVPGLAADNDITAVDADANAPVAIAADLEVTLGLAYQVVALLATDYIDPSDFKALDGLSVDADNPENLIAYAETIGLLTENDIAQYRFRFKKDFDFEAPATRQEYAVIIERLFSILKINGMEFALPKAASSSTSWAKGSGNGTGTSINIGGGNSGSNLTIDYYRDYKDLAGYAQKAFSSALMIGFLDVKKYEDTKTVKLKVNSPSVTAKSMFLAPNDIITVGDLSEGLKVFKSLKLTEFSRANLKSSLISLDITDDGNIVIVNTEDAGEEESED